MFPYVCKQTFYISRACISQKVKSDAILSVHYFDVKTKMLAEFQIYISAPLRITYNDKLWSFQYFLDKDNSATISHINIWNLAIQTFRFLQGFSLHKLNEVFVERDCNYSLRGNIFPNSKLSKIYYRISFVLFPKIWDSKKQSSGVVL